MPTAKIEAPPRARKRHESGQASLDALARMPEIPADLIDQFVSGPKSAEAVNAATYAFKRAFIERALQAELTHHLGLEQGAAPADGNCRNGASGASPALMTRSLPCTRAA